MCLFDIVYIVAFEYEVKKSRKKEDQEWYRIQWNSFIDSISNISKHESSTFQLNRHVSLLTTSRLTFYLQFLCWSHVQSVSVFFFSFAMLHVIVMRQFSKPFSTEFNTLPSVDFWRNFKIMADWKKAQFWFI